MFDDASLRVQLEGRAELLDATLLRYRALVLMLKAFRWRDRLRKNATLLREVARVQGEVDEALGHVMRRARKEDWPRSSAVFACAQEVASLRAALTSLAARRLGEDEGPALGAQLLSLEVKVLTAPQLVVPGQRWAVALEVLPANLPELVRAGRFGALLAGVFSRPIEPTQRLPFSLEELDELVKAWPDGEAAVDEAWRRLERIDLAGTLVRYLRRRARRSPMATPRTGPETLLHAEFWRSLATSRLDALLESRVGPVTCRDGERFVVTHWLWRRERDPEARLEPAGALTAARTGLFELAHELAAFPSTRARGVPSWERLLLRAARADAARSDADWVKLRDALQLLLRVLGGGDRRLLPPLYRTLGRAQQAAPAPVGDASTLEGLVAQMREKVA